MQLAQYLFELHVCTTRHFSYKPCIDDTNSFPKEAPTVASLVQVRNKGKIIYFVLLRNTCLEDKMCSDLVLLFTAFKPPEFQYELHFK